MWWFSRAILRRHTLALILSMLVIASGMSTIAVALDQLGRLQGEAQAAAAARAGAADVDVTSLLPSGFTAVQVRELEALSTVRTGASYSVATVTATAVADDLSGTEVRVTAENSGSVALRSLTLTQGRLPRTVDEVALDNSLATGFIADAQLKPLHVGRSIRLLTSTGPRSFRIVGLVSDSAGIEPFAQSAVYVTPATLAARFPHAAVTPLVALRLTPGSGDASVTLALHRLRLRATAVDARAAIGTPLEEIQPAAGIVDALCVLLTALLVALSLSLLLDGHRRDIALLRSAGARRRDARRALLWIVLIGIVGGIALGALGATAVNSAIAGRRDIDLGALFVGAGVAIVASAAAAWVVVFRLLHRAPLDALSEAPQQEAGLSGTAGALAIVGLVLLAAGSLGALSGVNNLAIAGVVAIVVATALLAPHVGAWCVSVVAVVIAPLFHRATPAASDLRRERGNLGGAIAVLTLAATAAIATGGFGLAVIDAGQQWTQSLFVGDGVMRSPVVEPDGVATDIAHTPGVTGVGELRSFTELVSGLPENFEAADAGYLEGHGGLDLTGGSRQAVFSELGGGGPVAVISQSLSTSEGWRVGTRLPVAGASGTVVITVVGIAAHTFPGADGRETLIMGLSAARSSLGSDAAGFDSLEVSDGGNNGGMSTVAQRFGLAWTPLGTIETDVRNAVLDAIGLLLATTTVAIVLGLGGAVAAILASTRRRSREVALLRAIGLSRRAVRARLRFYALWLALASVGPGMLAGIIVGAVCASLASSPTLQVSLIPDPLLIGAIALALVVVVSVAAYLPARRAASRDMVAAISRR